ncbi:MAG TPA: LytTR family DNA-binding domain-containing protein [Chitinophagaceae bacterium]|nr:LytTR family DNA-binding domain-containing protein [Chitinophagaceae bacterium]
MIWKCLLVDDEPPAIRILEKYIDNVEQLEVAGTCTNAFQAMDMLQKHTIDLIFLDINMPKLTGIGFIKTLQHPPKVIFTTAYKEHAADAFELDAVDYLLKPVSFERFLRAVNKVIHNNKPVNVPANATENNQRFLYFRADRKMVKIFLEEIVYVESLKDYVKIHRQQGKPLVIKQSISTMEEILPPTLFVRIHRSFIVAINKITAFTNHDVEIGSTEIPIGRLYSYKMQQLKI